jgi:HEAT repeat protein
MARRQQSKNRPVSRELPEDRAVQIARDPRQTDIDRASACAEIGRQRSRSALPALIEIVSSGEEREPLFSALAAIGMIGSRAATRPLMKVIARSPPLKRQCALITLGQLADRRARQLFARTLSDPSELAKTRGIAAEALGLLPPSRQVVKALVSALADPSAEVRYSALCGAEALRCRECLPALRALLGDRVVVEGAHTLADQAANAVRIIEEYRAPRTVKRCRAT